MTKNIAILEMPHGVYRSDLPEEVQQAMVQLGVEEIPAVMPGSVAVDGKCLIQMAVGPAATAETLGALGLPGVVLVGLWAWSGEALEPFDVQTYDKYIPPVVQLNELGEEITSEPAPSGKCVSLFAGQAVPQGML